MDQGKKQNKREEAHDATLKFSGEAVKSQSKQVDILAAVELLGVSVGTKIDDTKLMDQGKKQNKREEAHGATLKFSSETAKSQVKGARAETTKLRLNYEALVYLILRAGGQHDPINGNCPDVIPTAFPELKGEGANAEEAQQDLVTCAVYVMDTFQVMADGTVISYSCMETGHGSTVHRLLLLANTAGVGHHVHHVMLLPREVTSEELKQMVQQAMQPATESRHGHVSCEETTQKRAVETPAVDKAANEGGVDYAVTMSEGYGRVGLIRAEENANWLSSIGEFRGCAKNNESTSEPVSDTAVDAEIAVDEAVTVEEAVPANVDAAADTTVSKGRSKNATANATNMIEAMEASCASYEQEHGEPVPTPHEQQQDGEMPELVDITPAVPVCTESAQHRSETGGMEDALGQTDTGTPVVDTVQSHLAQGLRTSPKGYTRDNSFGYLRKYELKLRSVLQELSIACRSGESPGTVISFLGLNFSEEGKADSTRFTNYLTSTESRTPEDKQFTADLISLVTDAEEVLNCLRGEEDNDFLVKDCVTERHRRACVYNAIKSFLHCSETQHSPLC